MKFPWARAVAAIFLTPLAAALGAALFAGPFYSVALWNFGPEKSPIFKVIAPIGSILIFGTWLGAAFSLFAALLTQVPLILLHRYAVPLSPLVYIAATTTFGLLLFWHLFPFPMSAPQGWDPKADGGLIVPTLLGAGGGIGLGLLWYLLVVSRLPGRA